MCVWGVEGVGRGACREEAACPDHLSSQIAVVRARAIFCVCAFVCVGWGGVETRGASEPATSL